MGEGNPNPGKMAPLTMETVAKLMEFYDVVLDNGSNELGKRSQTKLVQSSLRKAYYNKNLGLIRPGIMHHGSDVIHNARDFRLDYLEAAKISVPLSWELETLLKYLFMTRPKIPPEGFTVEALQRPLKAPSKPQKAAPSASNAAVPRPIAPTGPTAITPSRQTSITSWAPPQAQQPSKQKQQNEKNTIALVPNHLRQLWYLYKDISELPLHERVPGFVGSQEEFDKAFKHVDYAFRTPPKDLLSSADLFDHISRQDAYSIFFTISAAIYQYPEILEKGSLRMSANIATTLKSFFHSRSLIGGGTIKTQKNASAPSGNAQANGGGTIKTQKNASAPSSNAQANGQHNSRTRSPNITYGDVGALHHLPRLQKPLSHGVRLSNMGRYSCLSIDQKRSMMNAMNCPSKTTTVDLEFEDWLLHLPPNRKPLVNTLLWVFGGKQPLLQACHLKDKKSVAQTFIQCHPPAPPTQRGFLWFRFVLNLPYADFNAVISKKMRLMFACTAYDDCAIAKKLPSTELKVVTHNHEYKEVLHRDPTSPDFFSIDITPMVHSGGYLDHDFRIALLQDVHPYMMACTIFAVPAAPTGSILDRVLANPMVPKANALKLLSQDDEDIIADEFNISIIDQVSKARIKTPVRSPECKHIDCMDAEPFLQLYPSGRGKCFHCDKTVTFATLAVDEFMKEILSTAGSIVEKVTIFTDGSWKPVRKKRVVVDLSEPESKTKKKVKTSNEIVDLSFD